MKHTSIHIGLVLLVVCTLTISGCDGQTPTPPPGPSQVWILDPQDGANLPLGPIQIRLQGASFTGIDGFEVLINGVLLGTYAPTSTGSGGAEYGTMFFVEVTWTPGSTGTYEITARAKNAQDQYSPSVSVTVTVSLTLSEELEQEVIPLLPSPPPPREDWQAESTMDANCRAGPGTRFNETGFVPKGYTAEVVGRNEEGTWLELITPNGEGTCWASIIAFKVTFAIDELPVHTSDAQPLSSGEGDQGDGDQKEKENGGEQGATGCLITNTRTGQPECLSPCPAGATGPACTP